MMLTFSLLGFTCPGFFPQKTMCEQYVGMIRDINKAGSLVTILLLEEKATKARECDEINFCK